MPERPIAWTFAGRPGPRVRDRDRSDLLSPIAAALRVGHGAAVEFSWVLRSGPGGIPQFQPTTSGAARWWQASIGSIATTGTWHRVVEGYRPSRPGPGWIGAPCMPWPIPLRTPAESDSVLDAIAGGLRLTRSGLELRWEFRPCPVAPTDPPPPVELPRTGGSVPRPAIARPIERTDHLWERSPLWESRTRLSPSDSFREIADPAVACRVIETASRSLNGNYLRFRPTRRWGDGRPPAFPLSEREVALMFPSVGAEPSSSVRAGRREGALLAVGRDPTGLPVGPRVEPHQGRHLAVLGETGMGKSSLLVSLARRACRWGGVLLFDPLGETAEDLREALPPELLDRLVWIDPLGPASFNALAALGTRDPVSALRRERQLNELVVALRRVRSGRYADSGFWGPRLEEMLARALDAAASVPGGTLETAHALLASEGRGFRPLPSDSMETVRALGERIRARPEDADGARRLLFEVTRSPTLLGRLCSNSPDLTSADLVREGRIAIVSGRAAAVGESTARYLLAVLFAMAWSELLGRPEGAKIWVILDEAQWFAHDSLAEMLRLGRRRNVHVVLATQGLGSLPEAVADAVRTNVSDFVLFRGSPDDAREVARSVRGVDAEGILALARGSALLLLGKGTSVHWIRTSRTPRSDPRDDVAPDAPIPTIAPSPPPGLASPVASGTARAPSIETVVRALRERAHQAGGGSPVRILLADLRRAIDPDDALLRRAGSELRRSGTIVGGGRDAGGAYWWVDPSRLGDPLGPAGPTGSATGVARVDPGADGADPGSRNPPDA